MPLEVNKIYQGDSLQLLKEIKDDSISLSFWSPPYFVGKEYEKDLTYQDWVNLLQNTIKLHKKILKPGGFLVVNIADIVCFKDDSIPKYQSLNISKQRISVTREDVLRAKKEYPKYNRNQLAELLGCSEQTIDRRLNGNNIRGGKYQTMTRVHLVGDIVEKSGYDAGLYMYDRRIWKKDPSWQNSKWHGSSYRAIDEFEYLYVLWKPGQTIIDRSKITKDEWIEWGSRPVWNINSVRANNDHEAKFPEELAQRVIKLYSDKGEIVLDPFIGSGTTAVSAIKEERNFIGIELKNEFVKLSRKNVKKALEHSKQKSFI
ncbi:MAG: site-specific DNA-methyltransferase [Candidatus Paceibacterota bacterium]